MTNFKDNRSKAGQYPTLATARKPLATLISQLLIAGSCATLAMTAPAFAQDNTQQQREDSVKVADTANTTTTEENEEEFETEVIEVKGIRASQRGAIDRKKMGGTIMDSLVAEDVGQFPDKNVGEALQRIPGVQLDRDFGEGASISIRGVEPSLLRVEVNNVSAQGFGGERAVDFRAMASELIRSLDVIKGSEARLTEGGIGGTVQVNTRKPNEFEENYLSLNAEGQYNDLTGEPNDRFNLVGVYKFNDDLGLLVNLTSETKNTMIHAIRNTEWRMFDDYDNSPEKTFENEYAGVADQAACVDVDDPTLCEQQWYEFSPSTPRYGIWGREEDRISANAMIQYQWNDRLSSHIGYTYNDRDKLATDLNLHLESASSARVNPDSVVVDDQHNVTYFETALAGVTNRTLKFGWEQTTSILETGFRYDGDTWTLEGLASKSDSTQDIDSRDTHITAEGIAGIAVQLNNEGMPEWDFNDGYFYNSDDPTDMSDSFDVNDPSSYRSRSRYKYAPSHDESEETMAKLDFTYIPDSDFVTKILTGVQYTKQDMVNANWQFNIIRDVGQEYNGVEWTVDDQVALISGNTFESDELFDGYDLPVSTIGTYQAVDTFPFIDAIQAIADDNTTREDLDVRSGNYDVSVETRAIYLQGNFETYFGDMRLWGNVGVRYVETDTAANGDVREIIIVDQLDENGNVMTNPDTGEDLAGVEDPDSPDWFEGRRTVDGDYSDTLPSINLNLGIIPNELVLYMGAAKVMSRPKTTDLNVNATCTVYQTRLSEQEDINNVCTAGNPSLNPYRATQFDVALNWYPDENSVLSAAYFVKDITSWIINAETRYDVDFFGDGRLWDVRQKINGTGVKTQGIELQASTTFTWLPAPFDGFGGAVNYTRMTADDVGLFNQLNGEELPFPSQSENSYNLTAFYETDVWSIRLAYNYRDEYLASPADRSGNPVFVDDSGYLDAKIVYNITENLRVYADGRNLTGEVKSYNAGEHRLSDMQWSGREYAVGVTYQF